MRIFTRYILKEVLSHGLIGTAVFTFVIFMRDVTRILEVGGDEGTDVAGTGDGDLHQWMPSRSPSLRSSSSMAAFDAITRRRSPSWPTISASINRARPARVTAVMR